MAAKPRVVLVTGWANPQRSSIFEASLRLLSTLEPLCSGITWVVTNVTSEVPFSNKITLTKMESKYIGRDESPFRLIPYYLLHQSKVSLAILKLLPKVDVLVFAEGSDLSFFPILLARLARKKVIIRSDGRPSLVVKKYFRKPGKTKIALLRLGETVSYALASQIVPECKYMVELYHLQKYATKINIGNLYIDTYAFKKTKRLAERTYKVGYVGRLSNEKGALEFIKSLPLILRNKRDKAIVIGDGDLRDEIEHMLVKNNIQSKVELSGWIENKQLPLWLNDIKMVVVPSYYEGLPVLVLESMACGTAVLATAVGGIPDVIRDGETGFIMEDNSPACIAKNVIRVLNHPDLEQINAKARALIEREYTYETAVERYRNILESLG